MTQLGLAFGLRQEGQHRVEENSGGVVRVLREQAKRMSLQNGSVTPDQLRAWAERHEIRVHHFNVWGCLYSEKGWKKVRPVTSSRPKGHGNRVFAWQWEGAQP